MRAPSWSFRAPSRLAIIALARSRSRHEYRSPSSVSIAIWSRSDGKAARSAAKRLALVDSVMVISEDGCALGEEGRDALAMLRGVGVVIGGGKQRRDRFVSCGSTNRGKSTLVESCGLGCQRGYALRMGESFGGQFRIGHHPQQEASVVE